MSTPDLEIVVYFATHGSAEVGLRQAGLIAKQRPAGLLLFEGASGSL